MTASERIDSNLRTAASYVVFCLFLALLVAVLQGVYLNWSVGIPAYFVPGVVIQAAMAFVPALLGLAVAWSAVPVASRWGLRAGVVWLVGIGILAVLVPFSILNGLGSESIRRPQLVLGMVALGLACVTWIALGSGMGALLRRSAAGAALIAIGLLGASWVFAERRNAEVADLGFEASAKFRPHVFVVLVDTLRADHLSSYGYPKPTSPNVDAVAARGVAFRRAMAPSPWTRPSCTALLTARYPTSVGVINMQSPLPPDVPIVSQLLQNEGYATAGIISSVQISPQFGFDKGFDHLDNGWTFLRHVGMQPMLQRLGFGTSYPRYDARELTDAAIDWIRDQDPNEKPLFMYLHYSDPHAPYLPPVSADRWRSFMDDAENFTGEPPIRPPPGRKGELPDAQRRALVARYDAEIAYFDSQFGRLMAFLEEEGLVDDSLIIVTSDHGEEFYEHEGWAHGMTLYNEMLSIPLIVDFPNGSADAEGLESHHPVGLIDVVPTIEEVLGADWSAVEFHGESLLHPLRESDRPQRMFYAEAEKRGQRSLIFDDQKVIQYLDDDSNVVSEKYFALERDPGEHDVLVKGDPQIRSDLDELLVDFVHQLDRGAEDAVNLELDSDTVEELRALGYIE